MTERHQDQEIEQKLRAALDAEVDDVTAARLRAARLRALARLERRRRWPVWLGGVTAAGLVVALSLALLKPTDPPLTDNAVDFELLVSEGSLELYEDLEFYAWLASRETDDAG